MKNRIFASVVSICAGLSLVSMVAAPNIDQRQVPALTITTTKGDEAFIKNKQLNFEYENEKKYGKNFPRNISFYQGKSEFNNYVNYEGMEQDNPRSDSPLWARPTERYYQALPNGNTLYYEVNNDLDSNIVTIRYSLYDGKKAIKKNQKLTYAISASEGYCFIEVSGQFNQEEFGLVMLEEHRSISNEVAMKKLMISTTTGEAGDIETVELPKEIATQEISLTEQPINEKAIPFRVYRESQEDEEQKGISYYLYDVFSNQFEALGQHEYINNSYGEKLFNANNVFANGTHYELLEVLPKGATLKDANIEEKNQADDHLVQIEESDTDMEPVATYPHQLIVAKWDTKEQVYQTVLEYPITENTRWERIYRTNQIAVSENIEQGIHYMVYDIDSESVIYEGTIQLAHPTEGDELYLLNYSMY
ncbi:hypothetical protein SAMN05421767_1279 [Granulicatella balaenopterae]|uniref:Uncharacterized protein n=1 Tax=Granulicatella balaenopterae TaxID=137733 RepID=A0A1H9MH88_9LACT|nr:hypothetical protein [Granulicatella balaenopterae]SER23080.1 hypothetical protein SAMN05421767_1279 [Granulicatella balaenopterae]